MALATVDTTTLIESLFEVFRYRGYEAATLAELSKATGLKKSSLYHRFPDGKNDMVKAVIQYVGDLLLKEVIVPLEDKEKEIKIRFDNLINAIGLFYNDGKKNCLLNILSLGEVHEDVKILLSTIYNRLFAALIEVALELNDDKQLAIKKAESFLIVLQGSLVIQRLTGNMELFHQQMEQQKESFFLNA